MQHDHADKQTRRDFLKTTTAGLASSALARAQSDFHLVMNPDVELEPGDHEGHDVAHGRHTPHGAFPAPA